ncbi:MAG: NAD(P)(+) transhydrogenase (Re/Si-specific) subunit beta, partial [Bryobacteraceae bacterium]
MPDALVNLVYLLASALFIFALKGMSHPRTAVRGNLLGALGMLLAVVVTLLDRRIISYEIILAGLVLGSAIGAVLALKIQMTAMPQMVALLNGFGGAASALVAGAALAEALHLGSAMDMQFRVSTALSGLIGGVTFLGSLVAFGKLQELITSAAVVFPGRHAVNVLAALVNAALCVAVVMRPEELVFYWALLGA